MTARPKVLKGETIGATTGCGEMYVTLNEAPGDEHKIVEVIVTLGQKGGCASAQNEAVGRLITKLMAHGEPMKSIIKSLSGIGCQHHSPKMKTYSCPDAISRVLKDKFPEE